MLSVSSLNIISSHETSFSSLARGSSRCWESSESLYLLPHTPVLPASCRDKAPGSPGSSSPGAGTRRPRRGDTGAAAQRTPVASGWSVDTTGFLPKGNLVNESPLPPHKSNSGCGEGLAACRASGWDKMAAAKSSLKHPKLLMRMKPPQHPSRTPEGTKAQASPLSHSAGATCCSLNSVRYVAGMKVAFPARALRKRSPKSKECRVKRVKPPRTVVSDWLYIISIASSTGIII